MEKQSLLEKIEEKVVFKISRLFFLILAFISMVVVLLGAAYLIYGFSSTDKPSLLDEDKINITASEISNAMKKSPSLETNEQSNVSSSQSQKQNDPDKAVFEKYIDTLKILLPESKYSWQDKGYYTGGDYYTARRFVTTDEGIIKKVSSLIETLSGYKEYINAMERLCYVLRRFPEDQRLKPLEAFIDLYKQKLSDHKEAQTIAKREYEETLEKKNAAKLQSIIVIGSAISSMAFLAIFLVLFSMQRNIKSMSQKQ